MRRNIDPRPAPQCRKTIQVISTDLPQTRRKWWPVAKPGQEVDLCSLHPGFDVGLYPSTDARIMIAIWMGSAAIARAKGKAKLPITGCRQLAADLVSRMCRNPARGELREFSAQDL